jgi:hypothetical protein
MPQNYYYLVAGLPDILIDGAKKSTSLQAFLDETIEQIAPADAALLAALRYQHDNANCIALLEKKDTPFNPLGTFTREELEQEIKMTEQAPGYMTLFLEAHREGKLPFPNLALEDQLTWLFYEEMTVHANAFIREWFTFDQDLRNVLAGLNCRTYAENKGEGELPLSRSLAIIGANDVAGQVRKSTAPDFSLGAQYAWVEKVVSHHQSSLVAFEKNIDQLRWETLDELTTFTYFQIETLCAFYIKLGIVERWLSLDPAFGKEKLNTLLKELESSYSIADAV